MSYPFDMPKLTIEELEEMQPEFTSTYLEQQFTEPFTDTKYWLNPPEMPDMIETVDFNKNELHYIKRIKTEYGEYIDLNVLRNSVLGDPDFTEDYREFELSLLAWYCEQANLLKNAKKNGVKPSSLLEIYDNDLPVKSKKKDSNLGRLKEHVKLNYYVSGIQQ